MEFDKQRFFQALLDAPPERPLLEPPEHSEYLQRYVFDKLNAEEGFSWLDLDWDAFDLRHVMLEGYDRQYAHQHQGWLQGINAFLHKTPAASLSEKGFF